MAFYTTAIIELSQVGTGIIDGIITSKFLGTFEMAAVGLAHPYYSIAGIISGCISVGMQSMCTEEVGRGRIDKTNKIFSQAVVFGGLISLLVTVILVIFAPQISGILGARGAAENLREPTSIYLIGLAVGTPGFVLSAILAPAVQLDNGSKDVQNAALVCSITDIVVDILAAKLGLGLLGIGLATSLSNYANLLVLVLHFRKKDKIISFKPTKVEKDTILKMIYNGIEKLVRRAVNLVRPILINSLVIAAGGSMAMSVMSIRNSVNNFVEIPGTAIAGAVGLLAGLFYGEINKDDIKGVAHLAHKYDAICAIISTVLLFVLAKPIAVFYVGKDSEELPLLIFAIYCLALRSFFATLTISRVSYLQSLHKVKLAQLLTILLNLVYIVGCAYILSIPFGAYGIMAAFPVSEVLALVTIYIFYAVKTKRITPDPEEYIDLDESFDLGPGDVIDFPIKNADDAVLTSEQIMMFCKGHGIDSKKGYYASLCVEELAMNTIEHGFSSSKSSNTIDIRLVIRDGDIVVRLRDNCQSFNITKQAQLIQDNNDPASNPGVKIIYKLAKNISYYRTLETNNTIITIIE